MSGSEQKQLLEKKQRVRFYPEKEDKKPAILLKGVEWSLWLNKVLTRKDQRTMFLLKATEMKTREVIVAGKREFKFEYKPLKEKPLWLSPADLRRLRGYIDTMLQGEIFE